MRLNLPATAAALVALLAFSAPQALAQRGFDYCAVGQRTSAFVVDRTTRFNPTDEQILVAAAEQFFQNQAPGERIIVVALSGAFTEMRIVLNDCRPGCPPDGFFGRLVATCRPVIARSDYLAFERRFIETVRELLQNQEEAPASDIFRTVTEVARLVGANNYQPLRQLLLYSDLLEASQVLPAGQIRRLPPNEVVQRLQRAGVQPRLTGATVRVIGFGRDDGPGRAPLPQDVRNRVAEAWRAWLVAGGATDVQIGLR